MAGDAKRYGIDAEDPQLEQRMRLIELELAKRELANVQVGGTSKRRHRSDPPPITGLRLATRPVGGLGILWNPSDLPDFRKYEVQIATSDTFVNPVEFVVQGPEFVFKDGTAGVTYYIRVRQVNSRGKRSTFASYLNSETGQATFSDLASGAASNIIVYSQDGGFDPERFTPAVQAPIFAYYLRNKFNMPATAEVIIFGKVKGLFSQYVNHTFQVNLFVDDIIRDSYTTEFSNFTGGSISSGTITLPTFAMPILLGRGEHSVAFQLVWDPADAQYASDYFDPTEMKLYLWEQRN